MQPNPVIIEKYGIFAIFSFDTKNSVEQKD